MGRKAISLKVRHSVKELKEAYQRSTCAVERRRLQVIWLLAKGQSRKEVEVTSAYSEVSVREAVKRYNRNGLEGLTDKRHENPGAPPLLKDAEILHLAQIIRKDYAKGGIWSGHKVVKWLKDEYGKEVHVQRAYEYLAAIGMSQQVPRPYHRKADEVAQDIFKKNTARKGS